MTVRRKVAAYVALTKPRVIELLLVVTAPDDDPRRRTACPNLWLLVATLIGGAMSAGSAGAFNCYIDRDIDRVMKRTRGRPLVTGELTDREALVFAYGPRRGIHRLALALHQLARRGARRSPRSCFYVVVYSLILKRRTSQNIVWGGVAGCMPVLIGWAAVTGSLTWTPFILFLIIFLWTPPHYWPLSMKYKDDYAAAGVPMLAVVRGRAQVGLQVILYAWATVACSLLLIPVAGMGLAVLERRARHRRAGSSTRPTACTTSPSGTSRSRRCASSTARSRTCRCSSSRSGSTRCCRSEFRRRMPRRALRSRGRGSCAA